MVVILFYWLDIVVQYNKWFDKEMRQQGNFISYSLMTKHYDKLLDILKTPTGTS